MSKYSLLNSDKKLTRNVNVAKSLAIDVNRVLQLERLPALFYVGTKLSLSQRQSLAVADAASHGNRYMNKTEIRNKDTSLHGRGQRANLVQRQCKCNDNVNAAEMCPQCRHDELMQVGNSQEVKHPERLSNYQHENIRHNFVTQQSSGIQRYPDFFGLARQERLNELYIQIVAKTSESRQLRQQIDSLLQSPEGRFLLESMLDEARHKLIEILEERIKLLEEENAELSYSGTSEEVNSPNSSRGDNSERSRLQREKELREHEQQLQPLKRWEIRSQLGDINNQLAQIDRELATLPKGNISHQSTNQLLIERRDSLQKCRNELAQKLTGSAVEYEQWDKRWGAIRFGKSPECSSLQAAGCGPTSLAIVLNYMYQEDPESLASSGKIEFVTPVETAKYTETHGRVCSKDHGGTNGDTMITNVHTGWPGFQGKKISLAQVSSQLHSGNLVIFLCKSCTGKNSKGGAKGYSGHFMVLNGVDNTGTTYNVLDPGANENKDISTISHQELQSHAKGFWIIERI